MKKPIAKRKKKSQLQKPQHQEPGHAKRFDHLLDDAIFGVKKKSRRG